MRAKAEERNRNLRRNNFLFRKGDRVVRKNSMKDKLDEVWKGPYEILEVLDKNRVNVTENGKSWYITSRTSYP